MAAGDGLISMKPTSIVHAGTSASINADGGVDFTAVTSLSLNGVFTSTYDNYLIVLFGSSSSDMWVQYRMRSSGTDASGNNYVYQTLQAVNATASGSRSSATSAGYVAVLSSTQRDGMHIHVYGPNLAQPTAIRGVGVNGSGNASLHDAASTHSLSTAYDGITLASLSAITMTGTVHVFGYEE